MDVQVVFSLYSNCIIFQDKISSWYLICVYQVKWSISALSDPKYTIIGTWFITETLIIGWHCHITAPIIFTKQARQRWTTRLREPRAGHWLELKDWYCWSLLLRSSWDPPEIQVWSSGVMTYQLVFFHSQPAHSITITRLEHGTDPRSWCCSASWFFMA